ncbi:hypothetical protein [Pelomicrobium methylotrophicum]|uniref:Uncharacterized protein n=1 Tax=Pelomicrobium methylotrophicum TaxID=2602750 RepID=A0A5C7ETC8_9PROT|nr:hypothetical protein [Pelomicrobium methylotrophicum]TXF11925.1 hypothetical protein FR698_07945 [Pelomicrobium methylotrophicum]
MARERKAVDAATPATVRLMVRTVAALGNQPRYRANLGPFTREPKVVVVERWQAEALRADPMLEVAEAGG